MTGYAKVSTTIGNKKVNIEIKTLNSKQLDLIVKLPAFYRNHELDMRSMLAALERGKVELTVSEENATQGSELNKELLAARYREAADVARTQGLGNEPCMPLMAALAHMPDLWAGSNDSEMSDGDWATMQAAVQQAIGLTDQFRAHEGAVLEKDFHKHVDLIEAKLREIPAHEAERISTAKERIRRYMAEAAVKEVDENRFEQELIYYLEKLDITEEKVRLQKHIDYFRDTMAHEASCGKKLGFVAQEMGREINTTGSKANHVEIQKLVVVMKDELEKIKEQLGNVL